MKRYVKSMSHENQRILKCLSDVFSLHYVLNKSGAFMQCGVLHSTDLVELRRVILSLLQEVRPEAVALVDAFDIPDMVLRSVLGRKDGDVYKAMWEWVQLNPRNKHRFGVHIGNTLSSSSNLIYNYVVIYTHKLIFYWFNFLYFYIIPFSYSTILLILTCVV